MKVELLLAATLCMFCRSPECSYCRCNTWTLKWLSSIETQLKNWESANWPFNGTMAFPTLEEVEDIIYPLFKLNEGACNDFEWTTAINDLKLPGASVCLSFVSQVWHPAWKAQMFGTSHQLVNTTRVTEWTILIGIVLPGKCLGPSFTSCQLLTNAATCNHLEC